MSRAPHPDAAAWSAVAELLADLLLVELDAERLARLARLDDPAVRTALEAVGVSLPGDAAQLEELAADYYAAFVQPEHGGPLVQSLWTSGTYEGESAAAIRRLATRAGLELDRTIARGAPPDHLGSILALWAATRVAQPQVADELERSHLTWALAPLGRVGRGFYGDVARATSAFIELATSVATHEHLD